VQPLRALLEQTAAGDELRQPHAAARARRGDEARPALTRRRDGDGGQAGAPLALIGLGLLILAPIFARLMQFAVSRRRESLADVSGVSLTRYPPGLISALEKLQADKTVVHFNSRATAHLWIESPLAREASEGPFARFNRLFDTHPPLDERIKVLKEL